MNCRRRLTLAILLLLQLPALVALPRATGAQTAAAEQSTAIRWITPRGGEPFFVMGANYEGPTDQAWMLWEDDKFNPDLIAQDFARARWAGVNTLRIFVQKPLRDDINAGDFSKLDRVTALAREDNLRIILTFTDWAEPDLSRAADLNRRIAAHLAQEPSILAYDVKNEPQFTDVAGAIYPAGTTVPLQSGDLIPLYGERVARSAVADYRRSSQGNFIPSRMTEEQAYFIANYYELYRAFLDAASDWVGDHPGTTTMDYMDAPESASWQPYLAGVDATLGAWVDAQIAGVRSADPGRLITVGYSNIVFAKLPSNRSLDFQSIHRFASHGAGGLNVTFLVLDNLRRTFTPQPVLLEEFGYPGQVSNGSGGVTGYDPRTTANLETAVWAHLYANGYAGGAKWMLNNFPQGYDPAQNSFGMFDNNGQPKLTAHAMRRLSTIFAETSPGQFSGVRADAASAASYLYSAGDALVAGGKVYTGTNVTYQSSAPSGFFMYNDSGAQSLFATDNATATVNLPAVYGVPTEQLARVSLTGLDPQGQPYAPSMPTLAGDVLSVPLRALHSYRLTVLPAAFEQAGPTPSPDSVYFPQTAHNLSGEFLHYWQRNGGLSIFGYPISEPFTERGYTVQYFERNRFEWHPENQAPYNVLLGRLGADTVAGRTFEQVAPFESNPDHRYFPETGHALNFAFLGYWNRNGGLAQFGYPISEEIRERSATDGKEYTVQYFERARFEYHPENAPGGNTVLLGLLGVDSARGKGWVGR